MGLITLHGLRESTTLLGLLLGIPYPLIEHGAHLGACGHPDHPSCPRLIPPPRITFASTLEAPHWMSPVSMMS